MTCETMGERNSNSDCIYVKRLLNAYSEEFSFCCPQIRE